MSIVTLIGEYNLFKDIFETPSVSYPGLLLEKSYPSAEMQSV